MGGNIGLPWTWPCCGYYLAFKRRSAERQTITAITFIYSLIKPAKPDRGDASISNLGVHRTLCELTFFLSLFSLILHALPNVAYTVLTRRRTPRVHNSVWLGSIRTIALLSTLFSSGLMRRGPRLRFSPISLGTGFGINASTGEALGGKAVNGKPGDSDVELQPKIEIDDETDNVLDYANSSMLSFIFLTYVCEPHLPAG